MVGAERRRKPRPLVAAARDLRRRQTPAEAHLWTHLRGTQIGWSFRRQHIIDRFVVDFCCPAVRLIVEVDGSVHGLDDVANQDTWREQQLVALGYRVLRFPNGTVLERTNEVLAAIRDTANHLQSI